MANNSERIEDLIKMMEKKVPNPCSDFTLAFKHDPFNSSQVDQVEQLIEHVESSPNDVEARSALSRSFEFICGGKGLPSPQHINPNAKPRRPTTTEDPPTHPQLDAALELSSIVARKGLKRKPPRAFDRQVRRRETPPPTQEEEEFLFPLAEDPKSLWTWEDGQDFTIGQHSQPNSDHV
eukprot:TRINITY_DN9609_c0_g1_i1.p1 TRINITY_DN9609_c0_g1~~TRINITY_DN9609_c0_g1_i1.p1  ORF type:complete len:179 (+),score=44.71 TRINITY_DN9609_c0_g1_i1:209-745(+)